MHERTTMYVVGKGLELNLRALVFSVNQFVLL